MYEPVTIARQSGQIDILVEQLAIGLVDTRHSLGLHVAPFLDERRDDLRFLE